MIPDEVKLPPFITRRLGGYSLDECEFVIQTDTSGILPHSYPAKCDGAPILLPLSANKRQNIQQAGFPDGHPL